MPEQLAEQPRGIAARAGALFQSLPRRLYAGFQPNEIFDVALNPSVDCHQKIVRAQALLLFLCGRRRKEALHFPFYFLLLFRKKNEGKNEARHPSNHPCILLYFLYRLHPSQASKTGSAAE